MTVSVGEQFKGDAVKLGKKAWKPSKAEKEMNRKIDAAKAITPKATADTLELSGALKKRNVVKQQLDDYAPEKIEHMISLLYSIDFDSKMLTTSSIKANFGEYMNYIDIYDKLTSLAKKQSDEELARFEELSKKSVVSKDDIVKNELGKRLVSVSRPMEILKRRMEAYLGANGLRMDGTGLKESDVVPTFELSLGIIDSFKSHIVKEDEKKGFDKGLLRSGLFVKEDLRAVLQTADNAEEYIPAAYTTVLSELDSVSRVRSIKHIRDCMRSEEARLKSLNEIAGLHAAQLDKMLKADKPDDAAIKELRAKVAEEADHIADVKRTLIEVKACLVLAEAEARYVLADEESKEEMAKLAEEADRDYRRVLRRNLKLSMPLIAPKTVRSKAGISADEATGSKSDMANYEFKYMLGNWAKYVRGVSKDLVQAVSDYAQVTHYTVGSEVETEKLSKILSLLKKEKGRNNEQLRELETLLDRITVTGSEIPAWDSIPATLKVDAIDTDKLPKDKSIAALSKEEIAKIDKIPKETSAGKVKGSHRNALLNGTFRVWTDLDKDTPIFPHEPTINDLRQGKVSNCYMLAGTTGLVNLDPELIKKCIKDNGDGTVTVRLYKESQRMGAPRVPMFVRVPKRVPKLAMGGEILSSGALWMQLIERAAAQVGMFRKDRSGYQSLWYGKGDEWLTILTGASGQSLYENGRYTGPKFSEDGKIVYTEKEVEDTVAKTKKTVKEPVPGDIDNLFETMTIARSAKLIFHAGTKENASAGMNSGHAYTVLGTKTINGKRFVTLRNPYANMSRVETEQGKIEKSTDYTSSVADETHGQFDMPFEEFLDTMQTISVSFMDTAFAEETKDGNVLSLEQIVSLEATAKTASAAVDEGMDDMELMEDAMKYGLDTENMTLDQIKEELAKKKKEMGDDL